MKKKNGNTIWVIMTVVKSFLRNVIFMYGIRNGVSNNWARKRADRNDASFGALRFPDAICFYVYAWRSALLVRQQAYALAGLS